MVKVNRKIKIYLETSVVSGYFDSHLPDRQEMTREFFKKLKSNQYNGFVSSLVQEEVDLTDEPKRSKLILLVKEFVILDATKIEIQNLAQRYIDYQVIPAKYQYDALHLACATFYQTDVVASWNFKHMVNFKTKRLVNELNKRYNYKEIDILSPLEL